METQLISDSFISLLDSKWLSVVFPRRWEKYGYSCNTRHALRRPGWWRRVNSLSKTMIRCLILRAETNTCDRFIFNSFFSPQHRWPSDIGFCWNLLNYRRKRFHIYRPTLLLDLMSSLSHLYLPIMLPLILHLLMLSIYSTKQPWEVFKHFQGMNLLRHLYAVSTM